MECSVELQVARKEDLVKGAVCGFVGAVLLLEDKIIKQYICHIGKCSAAIDAPFQRQPFCQACAGSCCGGGCWQARKEAFFNLGLNVLRDVHARRQRDAAVE